MSNTPEAPVESLSFEAALAELERVVAALEQGEVALEESIKLYERGAALRAHCQKKLEDAEAKVAQITQGPDGRVDAKPVEIG
jgi:exodeoxyribonuclease VII small subunit